MQSRRGIGWLRSHERAEFGEAQRDYACSEGNGELLLASAGRRSRRNWALRTHPRYFRETLRKQLVRMIRAPLGHGRARAGDGAASWTRDRCWLQAVWAMPMRGGASRKQFAPIWSRFIAGGSFKVHRPKVRRFDCDGCTGLMAVLCRSGQAHRNIRRQPSRCSSSPAGGLRARPDGPVVGPRGTH